MIKILFVCFGNTDRSPMAEMVMRYLLCKHCPEHRITVASAGSDAVEGKEMSHMAQMTLNDHHIPYYQKRAHQFTSDDYREYDKIYTMDEATLTVLKFRTDKDPAGKIRMLLMHSIKDPWDRFDYESVFEEIRKGCMRIIDELPAE